MKKQAFDYIDSHKDEMMKMWEDLVNTDSGSYDKEGVDKVGQKVAAVLTEAGAQVKFVEFEKAGNTLVANFAGGAKAPVLFSGHMDTVFKKGDAAKRPFTIKEGKAYGPGVLDMKAGVTILTFAAKALKAAGYDERTIKLVFAGDEEIAHTDSTAADTFMAEAKGCAAAFNGETGFIDNSYVTGRKGTARFQLAIDGVASHAGNDPKRGRSAILEAAHKVIDIQNLTDWDRGFSFNVGNINGGTIFNAVPGYCELDVDIRYMDPNIIPELEAMVNKVAAKTYVDGTTTKVVNFKQGITAMQTTEGVKKLFKLLVKTSEENGFGTPTSKTVGGGADSAYTVLAGVPTICSIGVKGQFNHAPEEYAVVDSLFERAKLVVATVLNLDQLDDMDA